MHESGNQGDPVKVLLLSSRRSSASDSKREEKSFVFMVKALATAGIGAEHRAIRFEKDLLEAIRRAEPDVVMNALRAADHAEAQYLGIQRVLKEKGYPCIGTNADTLALIASRSGLLERWRKGGIRAPETIAIENPRDGRFDGLDETWLARSFPCVILPDSPKQSRDTGYCSPAFSRAELRKGITRLSRKVGRVVLREFLEGKTDARLFVVGIIGNGDRSIVMPSELCLSKGVILEAILDRDIAKHRIGTMPVDDLELGDELKHFAKAAYRGAGACDFARLDVVRAGGTFYAMDILAQPLVPDRLFEACASYAGLDRYQSTIAVFVAGFSRLFHEGNASIPIPSKIRESLPEPFFSLLYG
jgi:D-alanine-D-alanine ligase-like ATP-grasp enzyme